MDGAEFAERDKALWAILVLDKMWLAVSVLPSNPTASPMMSRMYLKLPFN
jgi:hypothetical protein